VLWLAYTLTSPEIKVNVVVTASYAGRFASRNIAAEIM